MNIAYAYEYCADDVDFQSGYPFFILEQLRKRSRIVELFPLDLRTRYVFGPKVLFHRYRGKTYRPDREPLLLKSLASQIARGVETGQPDCIFSPASSALSFLDIDVPKVFCADATFANVIDVYREYSGCSDEYVRQAHAQEARALDTCAAAIYPSHFAAATAVEHYGADPKKVHVLPFGANLDVPPRHAIEAVIARRTLAPLRILFNGRDWDRKGGDIVLQACEIAHRQGVHLRLDLVGPDATPSLPGFATLHGLLRKSHPGQRRRFERLLAESDLLFMPSRAENYGIALCEAAAYGIPSLSNAVGGIPTIVQTGISGYALPANSPPEAYAAVIRDCASDLGRYRALCRSTRRHYEQQLSWDRFGDGLMRILRDPRGTATETAAAAAV